MGQVMPLLLARQALISEDYTRKPGRGTKQRQGNGMHKILRVIGRELEEMALPAFFFFVVFNIVTITKRLMLEEYHIKYSGFIAATVGALLVAKAVLASDSIKFVNKYPNKPIIYNVIWKTVIYGLATLVVQFFEEFFPLAWEYRSLLTAVERIWDEIIWPHFWAVHILLIFFLALYVSFRELARAIGETEFLKIFLGLEISPNKPQMR